MDEDVIKINFNWLDSIGKYFFKNYIVFVFNLLAFFSIVIGLSSFFGFSLKIGFLVQMTNLFSPFLWFLLGFAFLISGFLVYHKKYKWVFAPFLIWLLISAGYIRTQNIPDLKDVATGGWTLGPDLDPFLYLRIAEEINAGNYTETDYMRRAPLGSENYAKTNLMPWAIVFIFKISKIFGNDSLTYAAIICPVIFFLITIISFFFFVYHFSSLRFSNNKAKLIATIASFLYAFSNTLLHRTTAGIPEIESLAMIWFWFALGFFVLAWKKDNLKNFVVCGLLSGIFTSLMIWSWGGYNYLFLIISLTSLLAFLVNKDAKKNLLIYSSWFFVSLLFLFLKVKSTGILTSVTSFVLPFGVFGILLLNYILFEKKLFSLKFVNKIKLPDNIKTILLLGALSFIFLMLINPLIITLILSSIIEQLLYPFVGTGRLGLTVAENSQIYLVDVINSVGKMFFFGFVLSAIILFYGFIKILNKKTRIWLGLSFVAFVLGTLFSRYSSSHLLNGEGPTSIFIYFGSITLFLFSFFYAYIKSWKKNSDLFKKFSEINIGLFIFISIFFWTALSMRGAIRLLFIATPFMIIFVSFLPVLFFESAKKSKEKIISNSLKLIVIIILIFFLSVFVQSANISSQSVKATIPSIYTQQWQKAMSWVEKNTSPESIFVHWWDYGYWVQTLGKRATVTDGGHAGGESAIHFIGRYILTTPKNTSAYSFMKTWNVSHLLIDSTELGKYSAYSRIGSDDSWDRISMIPVGEVDRTQILETPNGTIRIYPLSGYVDSDIIYENNGTKIFLPGPLFDKIGRPSLRAYLIGVVFEEMNIGEENSALKQPTGIFVYNNNQYRIPLRYVYINNQFIDFKAGINATFMIIPSVYSASGGFQIDAKGGGIYLSEKTGSSLLARTYLMENSLKDYNNLKLIHSEDDYIVSMLKAQGFEVGDFVFYQGFRGPIKIWEVEYPKNTKTYQEFQEFNYVPGSLDEEFY